MFVFRFLLPIRYLIPVAHSQEVETFDCRLSWQLPRKDAMMKAFLKHRKPVPSQVAAGHGDASPKAEHNPDDRQVESGSDVPEALC